MKDILMVPGLVMAAILCPLLLASACYVAIWRYYRAEKKGLTLNSYYD